MAGEEKGKPVPRLVLRSGAGPRIVKWAGRVVAGEPFDYPDEAGAKQLVNAGLFEFYKPAPKVRAKSGEGK